MPQFDTIEGNTDLLSGEAGLEMTPSGMLLQSVWNQWKETLEGDIYKSDAWYRRIIFVDGIENTTATGGGGTTGGGGKTGGKEVAGRAKSERTSSAPADRGRNAGYPAPPAQIRTCPIRAFGSYLGCLTAKRCSGHG